VLAGLKSLSRSNRRRGLSVVVRDSIGSSDPRPVLRAQDSDGGRGVKRPDHASGAGLGSEPDDNVPDVIELR
jgi:hypothetical protein